MRSSRATASRSSSPNSALRMRTPSPSDGCAPSGPSAWTGRSSSVDVISNGCSASTAPTTDESQVGVDIWILPLHDVGGAGDPELKSRIWGLFLPRCLALAGQRDARPGGGARTLLSRGSEVLHEPPVRLLGLVSDLPLQPALLGGGEDPDRVAVPVAVRGAGCQLEASDLLPNERGPGEGVVLLAGEQMPAQDGELSSHGHRGDGNLLMSPMAAITPAAAVAPIPGMVMIRRTSGQERTCSAMVRSTRLSSVFRNSTWRRLACTVSRSSAGRSWSPSQARPRLPNRSLAGGRPFNVRWSTAWIWFLARVRCLMSWACRDTRRRRSRVRSSPIHTEGTNPAASSLARVRASSRSVFALAEAIARTAMGLAITTRPA